MTPKEASAKYNAEWPALNAAKETAMAKGDKKAAKKCRQQLSQLSQTYRARHELNKPDEPDECPVCFCPCCGKRVVHEA
jgi:hypothetical protein